MASAIVTTVGAADANSYASEAEGDTYFADRLNSSAWTGATSAEKAQALFEARRELDLMRWKGSRVNSTQALAWPRDYVDNPDIPWASVEPADTYYYATDEIPNRIKEAQLDLALEFLRAGTTDLSVRDTNLDVKRKKVDVLETEWFHGSDRATGLDRFPRILAQIAPLLSAEGGIEIVRT